MQRSITPLGLMLTSVSAIIGSGWLFSAYYSAKLAGPAAIVSWVLGGFSAVCIAFVFAELCAMLPITGSSTRIPRFTHGTLVSFFFSWIIWLSYVSLAPIEVQAVIQYLRFYFPSMTTTAGVLTVNGYILATVLMMIVNVINFYSIRWLIRLNSFLTIIKLVIPTLMAVTLIIVYFIGSVGEHAVMSANVVNLSATHSAFMPFGVKGILSAVAVGGIVFSFNGFKQAAEMAGEAKNPGFALPFAIIGSIVVCLIIFLLLQTSFLSALQLENLQKGWEHLTLAGGISPFVSLFDQHKIGWAIPILYFGAIIAPLAAGLMYVGSSARSLYGISKCGQLPSFLQVTNTHGNAIYALGINFAVGMLMFAPLPGWNQMAAFLSSLMAITYSIAPINLLALRRQLPNYHRPFRLPFVELWGTVAFYVCTLLIYWSGWDTISKMSIALIVGMGVLLTYRFFAKEARSLKLDWYPANWLWVYLAGLTALSYLGTFGGGRAIIPFGVDFVVLAVFSLFVVVLAMKFRLPSAKAVEYIEEVMATVKA